MFKYRGYRLFTAAFFCAASSGCHAAAEATQAPQPPGAVQYRVSVEQSLDHARVRVCFPRRPPARLVPGNGGSADQLIDAFNLSEDRHIPLPHDASGIDLRSVPSAGCIAYRISLSTSHLAEVSTSHAVVNDLGTWLWQPAQRSTDSVDRELLTFDLPPGMVASVPFSPASNGSYRIDRTTLHYRARIAVGHIHKQTFSRAGCSAHIALLPGLSPTVETALVNHLQDAVDATASVLGNFPADRLQVIAVPTASLDDAPVRFGHTTRGGGAGVLLLVNENADPQALAHDWTAIHEFSHLLLPFISRSDAWLSEGMATYYQEVLRARAGLMTEADALERLARGAARLQQCTVSLQTKSQEMATTHDYPVVYWGGATYVLMADIELRRRSQGRVTLDGVLRKLHSTLGFQAAKIDAKDLMKIMDDLAGIEVFSSLADNLVYARPEAEVKAQLQALVETPSVYAADFKRIVSPTRTQDANASDIAKAAPPSGG